MTAELICAPSTLQNLLNLKTGIYVNIFSIPTYLVLVASFWGLFFSASIFVVSRVLTLRIRRWISLCIAGVGVFCFLSSAYFSALAIKYSLNGILNFPSNENFEIRSEWTRKFLTEITPLSNGYAILQNKIVAAGKSPDIFAFSDQNAGLIVLDWMNGPKFALVLELPGKELLEICDDGFIPNPSIWCERKP